MTPRHILLIAPGFPPLPGGGERYVAALAAELAQRGQRVTVLTSGAQLERDFWGGAAGAPPEYTAAGVMVRRCPVAPFPGGRPGLLLWRKAMVLLAALPGDQTPWLRRLGRWVPRLTGLETALADLTPPVDMVHGFNLSWEAALLVGAGYAHQQGCPWVVTPFAHFGPDPRGRVARNTMMDHQRALLRSAAAVLALTNSELTGLAAWGVYPRRTVVVGSGVDAPPMGDPTPVLHRLGLSPPYALFIGRASYDKGAVHAAEAALAAGQTLALVGQMTPEFSRFYGRLAPQTQRLIRPLGLLSEADKHAVLSAALCLLLPSRADSFGIVLLEAWLHGVPVIGARAGGIADVISHEEDGLLVDFGDVPGLRDAMLRLAQAEGWRRQLGERGRRKVVSRFNWPAVADRTWAAYVSVWEARRAGA